MAPETSGGPDLSDDDRRILARAMGDQVRHLRAAAGRCMGDLYPSIYLADAERAAALYERLTGEKLPEVPNHGA
jgi:hypothetical protein